jgi:hypothetical protein
MTLKADGTNGILQQYDYQVLTTAFTYTFAAGTTVLVINPAGTLATGTITFPAAPVDGMTVTFSSTQTITALTLAGNGKTIVSAATILPANQATTYVYRLSNTSWYPMTNVAGVIPRVSLPTGSVLQVVSTFKNDTFSSASSTFVDVTGLSVSITPTSATSTILVLVTSNYSENTGGSPAVFNLVRNSTNISAPATAPTYSGSVTPYNTGSDFSEQWSLNYLDSPATTSATTYKIQGRAGAGTWYINRRATADFSSTSSITVMEIAA